MALFADTIELKVPSKPQYVSIVRTLATDFARRMSFSSSAVEDVAVAISEACANVVRHAYPDADGSAEMIVKLSARHGQLTMEITDSGLGFMAAPAVSSGSHGGYGLILMKNLMDQVSLGTSSCRGTTVRMVKSMTLRR